MMKTLNLLVVSILMASSVGCCCCSRYSHWFNRGAYCGPRGIAPALAAPLAYAAPQQPVFAPQVAAPQFVPQQQVVMPQMMPQFVQSAAPVVSGCDSCCNSGCDSCCNDSCCGGSAYQGAGYGFPMQMQNSFGNGMPMSEGAVYGEGPMYDSGWSTGTGCEGCSSGYGGAGFESGTIVTPAPGPGGTPDPRPVD